MYVLRDRTIKRRTVLRGAFGGATFGVALPFLDAMAPRRAHGQTIPKRFAFFFKPNGMSAYRADAFSNPAADNWTPLQVGANYTFPATGTATPGSLWQGFIDRGLKGDISILSGIDVRLDICYTDINGEKRISHDANCFLLAPYKYVRVGAQMYQTKAGGRSLDKAIADRIGAGTKFSTLEFGVHLASNTVAPLAVYVSYGAASQEARPEVNPSVMWTRLFASGVGGGPADPNAIARLRAQRQSVLDVVRGNINVLKKKLGTSDARRLDQHLTSIGEIEKTVTTIASSASECRQPAQPASLADNATNVGTNLKAQIDLMVMALACDLTRSSTLVLGGGQNDGNYPPAGVNMSHHGLTHGGDKALTDRIDQWQMGQIAYLIAQLKQAPEAGRTLLDSTVVLAGSESAGGWHHNSGGTTWNTERFPKGAPFDWGWILAGGTHYFRHGTHIRYRSGQVTHDQVLRAIYEACTGIEGAASKNWADPNLTGEVAAGLRGDRGSSMW